MSIADKMIVAGIAMTCVGLAAGAGSLVPALIFGGIAVGAWGAFKHL